MTTLLIFYAGAVLGAILGFFTAAMCTVSSRCSREEEEASTFPTRETTR